MYSPELKLQAVQEYLSLETAVWQNSVRSMGYGAESSSEID